MKKADRDLLAEHNAEQTRLRDRMTSQYTAEQLIIEAATCDAYFRNLTTEETARLIQIAVEAHRVLHRSI